MASRYEDRARRVAEAFGPGHHGVDNLTEAIVTVIREFVQHDTEWCAVATDELRRDLETPVEVAFKLSRLAESFRERGRAE